ncbi:hypothetical protein [Blastococcus sp. TF02A-26]|uniref:hypothetical protein n=1 Tax=Blastococcus sp. TF02A-26 TaxID=2250577 RepID=UPI000DEBAFB6|nr:hypothetical protein [Blastococcus sp. TF02A-26]RBY79746.1 hypothetical protein DQ240_22235 [Blastococcus sp. TF02A-26]
MAGVKQWSQLTGGQRALVVTGVVVDSVAKAAALRDLRRRPAAQVRGPKWLWGAAIALTGSLGAVPLAYFLVGRR